MHLQEYIPTVVVLTSPRFFRCGSDGGLDGLVLDGHHKIQAALEIGGPVRVITIEEKKEGYDGYYCPDCVWDDTFCDALFDNMIEDYYHPNPRRTRHSKKKSTIPDPTDIFVILK